MLLLELLKIRLALYLPRMRNEKCIRYICQKLLGKEQVRENIRIWKESIKIDLMEIDWIHNVPVNVNWQASVNRIMNVGDQ
jgi:hypothetical protein